jgi:hypothetical protein
MEMVREEGTSNYTTLLFVSFLTFLCTDTLKFNFI